MYNPSRGGVRGGTDQFTWDSVKTDKHRENYLGHSLMAPVGRWQKGKDLSWYTKERKSEKDGEKSTKMADEKMAVKKAEEEAMMIALGLKEPKKEDKTLVKEDIAEVLKRNPSDRGEMSTERIGGLGLESERMSMMMNRRTKKSNDGVMFETVKSADKQSKTTHEYEDSKSYKKSSKKNKKEKKHKKKKKKRNRMLSDSGSSGDDVRSLNPKGRTEKSAPHGKNSKSSRPHADESDSDGNAKRSKHGTHSVDIKPIHSSASKKYPDSTKMVKRTRHDSSDDDIDEDVSKYKKSAKYRYSESSCKKIVPRIRGESPIRHKRHDTSSSESE